MIIPFCGVPTKQERYSPTTVATLLSSMLNSIWTMFVLYWDLFGCNKKMSDVEGCCIFVRNAYGPETSIFPCYCGWCGCVNCRCVCLFPCGTQQKPSKHSEQKCGRCRRIALRVGKTILFGMIFLLYLGIFIVGGMTPSNAYHKPVLDRAIIKETEVSKSVLADRIGPGLDAKPDEAMFITMVYELPNWYHVGVYDNSNVNIANSSSVHQIQNRLYIGQFKELEHLKYGTLTKTIPCNRAFPFVDKIDKSLFQWNNSQKLDMTDFSNCKVIFRFKYHPPNGNWNPFVKLMHIFKKNIRVEWGIYIEDHNTCPIGFQPLPVSLLLTDTVKQDIVHYTCSPSCINATGICHDASYGTFEKNDFETFSTRNTGLFITTDPQLFLTIKDRQQIDFCFFKTKFQYTNDFCGKFWASFHPVKVPDFVRQSYPQFITIPMMYKEKENALYFFLDSKCSKLWAEGEKISI